MKIIIKASPKEIAALVVAIQERSEHKEASAEELKALIERKDFLKNVKG